MQEFGVCGRWKVRSYEYFNGWRYVEWYVYFGKHPYCVQGNGSAERTGAAVVGRVV